MILITGATGHVGRRCAQILAADHLPLRLMARDPARAERLPGAEVVHGDYGDPRSLDAAFSGIDAALVVSGSAEPMQRARLHANAFEAAARAGVRHLVYLSFQGASPHSKFPYSRDHFASEKALGHSGVTFTALRDNFYMDLLPTMFDAYGILRDPGRGGKAAFVSREDVAQVAAAVLRNPPTSSATWNVTGPEALSLEEVVHRLAAKVGRRLHYVPETVEEGRAWRSKLASEPWEVDVWIGSYLAIAAGELEATSDAVERFTGRAPLSFDAYFDDRPELLAPLRR
ncbi:MAG: SDR family oxidoreductase [Myxococcaceae bacterium]